MVQMNRQGAAIQKTTVEDLESFDLMEFSYDILLTLYICPLTWMLITKVNDLYERLYHTLVSDYQVPCQPIFFSWRKWGWRLKMPSF